LPILLIYISSFTAEAAIQSDGFSLWPKEWSTAAYEMMFKDGAQIAQSYLVSIVLTVLGTVLSILIMTMYAYALARKEFAFRQVLTFFAYFTMLFSGGMVASYMINTTVFHLRNTFWVLLLPGMCGAYNIIVLRTFFTTAGTESIIEAAKIDGAGEFRIYGQIILPLSKPAIATIGLFTAIMYFSKWFDVMLYIDKPNLYTVQYLLMRVMKNIEFIRGNPEFAMTEEGIEMMRNMPNESAKMALTVIAMTPVLVFYPFFQKYFVKGLVLGAVKG
ncbi:MAG: carbohydrate ABC transporter permease, partial [Clostridia bacterium]